MPADPHRYALTPDDLSAAARTLGCDVPAVRAVDEVESKGAGFLPPAYAGAERLPKILFEPHIFHSLTRGRYDRHTVAISGRTYRLSYPSQRRGEYGPEGIQHLKLAEAAKLDRNAALASCSWGRYQIMGFNYEACGFDRLQAFVNAMYASERKQLDAFVAFVRSQGLADELQRHDWAGFARRYNGPGYDDLPGRENDYDVRLERAYHKALAGQPT